MTIIPQTAEGVREAVGKVSRVKGGGRCCKGLRKFGLVCPTTTVRMGPVIRVQKVISRPSEVVVLKSFCGINSICLSVRGVSGQSCIGVD